MFTFDSVYDFEIVSKKFYHNEIVCIQKICTKPKKKIMREKSFDLKSSLNIFQGPVKSSTT